MSSHHSSSVGSGTGISSVPQVSATTASSPYRSEVLISRNGAPSYSGDGSRCPTIPSLHQVVGASDGRGRPEPTQAENAPGRGGDCLRAPAATVEQREPVSSRAFSSLLAGWQRLTDSLLGDAIGLASTIAIFLTFYFLTA